MAAYLQGSTGGSATAQTRTSWSWWSPRRTTAASRTASTRTSTMATSSTTPAGVCVCVCVCVCVLISPVTRCQLLTFSWHEASQNIRGQFQSVGRFTACSLPFLYPRSRLGNDRLIMSRPVDAFGPIYNKFRRVLGCWHPPVLSCLPTRLSACVPGSPVLSCLPTRLSACVPGCRGVIALVGRIWPGLPPLSCHTCLVMSKLRSQGPSFRP